MLQTLLTALIVAAAVAYAAWRIVDALRSFSDPCHGCAGCPLREARRKQVREQQKKHEKRPDCYHGK